MSRAAYQRDYRKAAADGGTFHLDEVAIENIDGRQPEEPFTATWDRIIDPDVPQDAKNDLALEAVTAMARRLPCRHGARSTAFRCEVPKEGASFSLDGVTLTGWSSAGLDSFILKKLNVAESAGLRVARLDGACRLRLAGSERADAVRRAREGC